jgi:hypothetical protein
LNSEFRLDSAAFVGRNRIHYFPYELRLVIVMEHPGALILLHKPTALNEGRISAALAARYPDVPVVVGGDDTKILINFSGLMILASYFDVPLPPAWPAEIERARRVRWPEADKVFRSHKAHILISVVRGEGFSRQRMAHAASAAIGAILDSHPECSAVLWDKTVLTPAAEAAELSRSAFDPDDVPAPLWIDLDPFEDRRTSTSGIVTMGLRHFIGREIEMEGRHKDWDVLQAAIGDMIHYALKEGVQIKDGETFSNTDYAHVRIPMRFRTSTRYRGLPIIAITLPPAKR